jgi:adenine/guanine phosphoribosyltransferase-like PRPP-binding protein
MSIQTFDLRRLRAARDLPEDLRERLPAETVLYVTPPRGTSPEEIDPSLNTQPAEVLTSSELVVIRAHEPLAGRLAADDGARAELTLRFPGRTVLSLRFAQGHYRFEVLAGTDPPPAGDQERALLELLRQVELEDMLEAPGVWLPEDPAVHYQGPHAVHYRSFIRPGIAMQDVDSLDAVAFWLLEHLGAQTVLLLDSPTLLAAGANLQSYVRALPDSEVTVASVESRLNDDDSRELLQRRAGAAAAELQAAGADPRVLVVVSVSSTGETAAALEALARRTPATDVAVVSLYARSEDLGRDALCTVDSSTGQWPAAACPLCAYGSTPLAIDPATNLLQVGFTRQSRITRQVARQAYDFFDLYRGSKAFVVHRDEPGSERHHMIDVDVDVLLDREDFRAALAREVAKRPEFDLILGPSHATARRLATMVSAHSGKPAVSCDETSFGQLGSADQDLVRTARRILLVDDVINTGARLRGYRIYLRRFRELRDDFELHVLVALARPPSNEALRALTDFVHKPERFTPVSTLVLPNWGSEECPWCWEQSQLRALSLRPGAAAARLAHLEERGRGLREALFIPWSADDRGYYDLGPDSIFHVEGQAEVFAAVANTLQLMRDGQQLTEYRTSPVAHVLDPDFYLDGRFYEPVIQACIWRAARRHDVRAADTDPKLVRSLANKLSENEPALRGLRGEILLNMARHRLPRCGGAVMGRALEDETGDLGVREALARLLERSSES